MNGFNEIKNFIKRFSFRPNWRLLGVLCALYTALCRSLNVNLSKLLSNYSSQNFSDWTRKFYCFTEHWMFAWMQIHSNCYSYQKTTSYANVCTMYGILCVCPGYTFPEHSLIQYWYAYQSIKLKNAIKRIAIKYATPAVLTTPPKEKLQFWFLNTHARALHTSTPQI